MNEENQTIIDLLVTTPYRYNDLITYVYNSLGISPLPRKAADFYALANYKKNESNFKNFLNNKVPIEQIRNEFLQLIEKQDKKIYELQKNDLIKEKNIEDLEKEITSLKQNVNESKNSLFTIQLRDVIKAFISQIKLSLNIAKKGETIELIKSEINNLTEGKTDDEKKGSKMIIELLEKLNSFKGVGDDLGHAINDIGFNEKLLPKNIKDKYFLFKRESNCQIENCDCLALILSVNDINDSNDEMTKKKYELIRSIINISWKDWENNKKNLINLLVSY